MNTLFISDLHLVDDGPQACGLLTRFLRGPARQADALYILGDLFELWIGDDAPGRTALTVAEEITALSQSGVPCHFQHGNRDFLLGQDYAHRAGLHLLPESCVTDLYGTPTLLLHGDTLCTDDLEYQAFRRQVRDPAFIRQFLAMSGEQRLHMARQARDASRQHTGSMAWTGIMDVNESDARAAFLQNGVRRMIHGHTHRPAIHHCTLSPEMTGERVVLGAWHNRSGSYLRVSPDKCELVDFSG
jgi:UDP-2,3-diacylglucosamine hydrolase